MNEALIDGLLGILSNYGLAGILLVAAGVGARAAWRFLVDEAFPAWIETRRNAQEHQVNAAAKLHQVRVAVVDCSNSMDELAEEIKTLVRLLSADKGV
jgi:hypothetical protein